MAEMEQTNKYNDLVFDKQQNNQLKSNYQLYEEDDGGGGGGGGEPVLRAEEKVPNEHRPSILNDFHMTYLEPRRRPTDETRGATGASLSAPASAKRPRTHKNERRLYSTGLLNTDDLGDDVNDDEAETGNDWNAFSRYLDTILDIYTYRDSLMFVEEFKRIENYLVHEYNQAESDEANVYFQNQSEVAVHLNELVKVNFL